ncbi:DEAD/DEAH box helicase family protein [Blastochloris tepida]|uniref:Uncharacterized protein n=1 Tax=Blastochloris tepida TaxID=2233851 RepID=A0A348G3D2_9HYPH|nr:DEAD/DEAH box helicase family protein [Blastochloris tepida]BBF94065.1 hypothetical protein BLTE_27500 [Blastochloris tepida]
MLVTARPSDLSQIKSNLLGTTFTVPEFDPTSAPAVTPRGIFVDLDTLTTPAITLTKLRLAAFGSKLSVEHEEAIARLISRFTLQANGEQRGRYAVAMPCGTGKTLALVCWCATLVRSRLPYSVLICASKVDELVAIRRQLKEVGVADDEVGLVHSLGYDRADPTDLRRPTDDNDQRRILLVTHARVKGGGLDASVIRFRGKRRSVVVWDESLIVSAAQSVELASLLPAVDWLLKRDALTGTENEDRARLRDYLERAVAIIEAEQRRLAKSTKPKPRTIHMPLMHEDGRTAFKAALPNIVTVEPIRTFLDMASEPLRLLGVRQGHGGVIRYDLAVPTDLDNVVILDASTPIRTLVDADRTIKADDWFPGRTIKTYGDVTIRWWKRAGGREAMEREFAKPRDQRTVSREIVKAVKSIPTNEAVLVFTHKPHKRQPDIGATLRADLKAAGIDVDAVLPDGFPRFSWATFGRETATSEWVRCRHVFLVGAMYRSDLDLGAALVGQRDDLTAAVSGTEIREAQHSEIAHSVLQAVNRAACRTTLDGKAAPTTAHLILYDREPLDLVASVMPGLRIEDWETETGQEGMKTEAVKLAIVAYLSALPEGADSVTLVALKKVITADLEVNLSNKSWQVARDRACVEAGWQVEGRRLVRN